MNSDLLARIFSFLIFVAFTAVGILFARFRGKLGEWRVGQILRHLPKKQYIAVNDLLLFNGGASSQIDHVVVSVYGVFVVETKCYRGWIYGSERSAWPPLRPFSAPSTTTPPPTRNVIRNSPVGTQNMVLASKLQHIRLV